MGVCYIKSVLIVIFLAKTAKLLYLKLFKINIFETDFVLKAFCNNSMSYKRILSIGFLKYFKRKQNETVECFSSLLNQENRSFCSSVTFELRDQHRIKLTNNLKTASERKARAFVQRL